MNPDHGLGNVLSPCWLWFYLILQNHEEDTMMPSDKAGLSSGHLAKVTQTSSTPKAISSSDSFSLSSMAGFAMSSNEKWKQIKIKESSECAVNIF